MRRYIRPGQDAAVWIASGRWGPKRVKVTQCWAVLKAEDVYTGLLRDDAARTRPGARGVLRWTLPAGRSVEVSWELRANAVWRFGRVFLRCLECSGRATRIYIPSENLPARCRRCWGLTYESRRENYKPSGSVLGMSHRMHAQWFTWSARERRAEAAAERYAERRELLTRASRASL